VIKQFIPAKVYTGNITSNKKTEMIHNNETQNPQLYISKKVKGSFEEVQKKVEVKLAENNFGIVTHIDMDAKLKEKLNYDQLGTYQIFGICNPALAHEAIKAESNIGVFLPCKIIIRKTAANEFEVASYNPSLMMGMLGNNALNPIAAEVTKSLEAIINTL
jgi:uncharacterized protein (DUF302 family)